MLTTQCKLILRVKLQVLNKKQLPLQNRLRQRKEKMYIFILSDRTLSYYSPYEQLEIVIAKTLKYK